MTTKRMIEKILQRQNDNGGHFWSRADGDIHAPLGFSTIDTLSVLGEIGFSMNDNPQIADAIDFLFAYQTPEGCFKYSLKSSKLPCLTARIIAALGRLGLRNDYRIEKSYKWMLDSQCNDGGWRCPTVKSGKSPMTDASNPGTTLYVLDAFRFRDNSAADLEKLNIGVDFLLQHWEIRQPIGPCGFGIGSVFMKVEYPFLRYNLFYYVYVLSFYDIVKNDKRFQEAFNTLKNKLKMGN
ncbi:MAG: terpene cyclase/mutase family protein [Bacteroidales bacterium]|nr:terpene cyclase/mutase family protein [Bacteroidales bacterium]